MVSLLSDEEIDRIASFDITETLNLYDPRFGHINSNEYLCLVCNMPDNICLGHFASLSLGFKMFHPFIYKHAEELLNTTCWNCGESLPVVLKVHKHKCNKCNTVNKSSYVISPKSLDILTSNKVVGFKMSASDIPSNILPKGYILSKILIPPIQFRTPEDMEWPSDFQKLYDNLVQIIRNKKSKPFDICNAYADILGLNKKNGITKILSGKDGIFRKLMIGKRVENSARAVIVGNPDLELDQVLIPMEISTKLKIQVFCSRINVKFLRELAVNNKLWWDKTDDLVEPSNVIPGMAFKRTLLDDDLVLLNRQPSLSRFSLMCFRIKLNNDPNNHTLGINPQITAPFNADFDGDEMNIFMFPDHTEIYNLCHLSKCIKADNIKSTIIVPVQDVVTGCYLMSIEDRPVSKDVFYECANYCNVNTIYNTYTTKTILSMCIPNYKGEVITKKELSSIIYELDDKALNMIYILQKVIERWLETYGLTISIKSLFIKDNIHKEDNETPDMFRERCYETIQKELKDTDIIHIVNSGAKGSITHLSHMCIALGQQYIKGNRGTFCKRSYLEGLTPDEFFGHQMAAREGVVSTGTSTAITGYLNRKTCKIMADAITQYNNTVADEYGVFEFL